ncbi:rhodanese-like domain-containing protein [Candidatus Leptofilum sp.]|uniref:rhodanese-like domain-containing protein n=1 Tax=Candidatus Leptofilum sp. TaxID=3241576 RepID=UPI003B5A0199
MNPYGVPGLSVQEVAQKRENGDNFILLDVREPNELLYANLGSGVLTAPLSKLARQGPESLPEAVLADKDAEIVVLCHHGNRSAQVTAWLRQQGWTNVLNMDGGIDAYAIAVDPSVGRY